MQSAPGSVPGNGPSRIVGDADSAPPWVRVSYWTKPGRPDVLLAAANWSDADVDARLELPRNLRGEGEWVDMESGDRFPQGGRLTLRVGHHDLRALRLLVPR